MGSAWLKRRSDRSSWRPTNSSVGLLEQSPTAACALSLPAYRSHAQLRELRCRFPLCPSSGDRQVAERREPARPGASISIHGYKQAASARSRTDVSASTWSLWHTQKPNNFPVFPSGWLVLPQRLLRHGNRLSPFRDTILWVGCLLLTLNPSTLRFFYHCSTRISVTAVRLVASSLFTGIVYL